MDGKILVTGGCGFIGSNFVQMLGKMGMGGRTVVVDNMTYAADKENLNGSGVSLIVEADIADEMAIERVLSLHRPEFIVNFAAESHVDRSITSAGPFVRSNVVGVQVLLDASKRHGVGRFLQVSTDEVYGDLGPQARPSKECDNLRPSSPYSASKAAADLLALSYVRTYGMDVVVTRCSNNYGPRQYPEKLIPLAIRRLAEGKKVPVYGTGENVRDWIYVDDHCKGIWAALTKGRKGEVYNFGGANQVRNIDLVRTLLVLMMKSVEQVEFVTDRPGHDTRYDIDFRKAANELGWSPEVAFDAGLKRTVEWYGAQKGWK